MLPCFGLYTRIQKLIMLSTFESIFDFFQYAFKDIISRVSSSDVLVHFFHKSSCAISIRSDVLHKFYKMIFYFVHFLFASLYICILFVTG